MSPASSHVSIYGFGYDTDGKFDSEKEKIVAFFQIYLKSTSTYLVLNNFIPGKWTFAGRRPLPKVFSKHQIATQKHHNTIFFSQNLGTAQTILQARRMIKISKEESQWWDINEKIVSLSNPVQ